MTNTCFGFLPDGTEVRVYRLENERFVVDVTEYGATLVGWTVKKNWIDIVSGYSTIHNYIDNSTFMGAAVGRVCNRIRNGRFRINGNSYQLDRNDHGNNLHSGKATFGHRMYTAVPVSDTEIRFEIESPDGDGGFPGNLKAAVTYRLTAEGLEFEWEGQSDADTLLNMTNHAYFNLEGPLSKSVLNHQLLVNADKINMIDEDGLSLEETMDVAGTPFDFRLFKKIGQDIEADDQQLANGHGYDHNFIVKGEGMRQHAVLRCGDLCLTVSSDLPAIQVYTGNFLDGSLKGKQGGTFPRRSGVCLETQFVPDCINMSAFDKPVLKAGEVVRHKTIYTIK